MVKWHNVKCGFSCICALYIVTYVAIYHPPCTAIVSDDFHLRPRRPVIVQLVASPWMVAHEGVGWLPCTQSERSDSCPCLSVRILVHLAEKLRGAGCRGQMRNERLKSVNIRVTNRNNNTEAKP